MIPIALRCRIALGSSRSGHRKLGHVKSRCGVGFCVHVVARDRNGTACGLPRRNLRDTSDEERANDEARIVRVQLEGTRVDDVGSHTRINRLS